MSDKNITPEEDYLDSLLRSIAGGTDDGEIDDNLIAEDIDFDKEVDGGMSEDEFLSDFEKEFFGENIDDNVKAPVSETIQESAIFQTDESFPEFDMLEKIGASEIPTEPMTQGISEMELEPELQMVQEMQLEETTQLDVEPELQVEPEQQVEPELQFEEEVQSEPETPANVEFDLVEDIMNVSDEQAMVEEAIASEDSSVEADLQGLYGILGMGNEEQELPADIEDTPKKKKGLFSKKDKKDKKEKKEKKKKGKKKKDLEAEVANTLVVEGEGLEDFDFSDFSLDALAGPDGGSLDSSDSAFDMTALDDGNSENGDLGLGFDDSIFGGLDENGENAEVVFDEDPFGDEEIDEEAELKAKKKQEKKEAKEKKKKEKEQAKKEKEKEKKKKPKKAPKPKKVKEPDEVINISPIFVVFALSFVIIIILVANIGGNYYHYNERFYDAVSLYVYGNNLEEGETLDQEAYEDKFSDAYNLIYGLEMKEKDHQVFYDQLTIIMLMDRHYEAYKSFMLNDDYAHGLDSLIKAIKMYDKYQNDARELKCFDEMTVVLSWVENKLMSTYGLSVSEARELSMIKDDDDYAVKVRAIAAEVEAENNKNKVDEE